MRGFAYLTLCSFLLSTLAYQWVFHRHAPPVPASALPRAELFLSAEPVPRLVWMALWPPLLLTGLLWWVITQGDTLPWRDNWLGPPQPAFHHKTFTMIAMAVMVCSSVAAWKVVLALARWHGMARAYPHRSRRLRLAVTIQWLWLATMVCWAAGNLFYMPVPWASLCAIGFGGGMFLFLWMVGQEERLRRDQPATGTWCYLDFRDPGFLSPRDLNLASAWAWLLAALGIAPILLMEWLYQHARDLP